MNAQNPKPPKPPKSLKFVYIVRDTEQMPEHKTIYLFRVSKISLLTREVVEEYNVQLQGDEYIGCDCMGFSMGRNAGGTHKHFRIVEHWLRYNRPPLSVYSIDSNNRMVEHALKIV